MPADSGLDLGDRVLKSFRLSSGKEVFYYSLPSLKEQGFNKIDRLPFSIRVVLESLLRNLDGKEVKYEDIIALADWDAKSPLDVDIPFKVSRILMQDFTGVPAIVDLAAMREYMVKEGCAPDSIQPIINVDLIIDHSVQVDEFNDPGAVAFNQEREIERNSERYKLLKWSHHAFEGFRVYPPSAGICHQVNLEYLSKCVVTKKKDGRLVAMPDTLVGTDSHTTMVDALGIVGFGVGGIEAEAALLGQAVSFTTPKVVGVHLKGRLREGVTATDFALTLTKRLRDKEVVNMFVEFFGDGLSALSLPDRATLSNMCPEYGATIALFHIDDVTLDYLKATGRTDEEIELVKRYYSEQGMLGLDHKQIMYSDVMEVDLGSIVPSVSGPSLPKQQLSLGAVKGNFTNTFLVREAEAMPEEHRLTTKDYTRWSSESLAAENGRIKNAPRHKEVKSVQIKYDDGYEATLSDGDVVISSITSCTNTSNPSVMIAAGLLAKRAVELGLKVNTRKVKTSMGPGSRVVTLYLEKAGLIEPLEKLGYGLVGYGCITCIGNSGNLIEKQSDAINRENLAVAAVLSGNRNYPARIHRDVRANYLMSPPLLISYAIAGTMLRDLTKEPLGKGSNGKDVYLRDIWPSEKEINKVIAKVVRQSLFKKEYGKKIFKVNPYWNKLRSTTEKMYDWDKSSTYIQHPPFFHEFNHREKHKAKEIRGARVLAVFGDSVSTDHISPAGSISSDSPAGRYLMELGVKPEDFNTYGSRRGNHHVMVRGTFANSRINNLMIPGIDGGLTFHFPSGEKMAIFHAAMKYREEKVPLVVIAGKEYGSGSSRDWAAKGPALLGVKAIIAESFERIHRSNLVGMGIMPLQFKGGENATTLKIDYSKPISIIIKEDTKPRSDIEFIYYKTGSSKESKTYVTCRLDTELEVEYYKVGGVLTYVLKKMAGKNAG
ncbi:MAG: aconitate hydratase AcnA [Candidatus Micrarchaeota archaeon]|nr:aconitate hydratase AcnA [Candidatus Micrarchaeota archaeon]